MPFQKKYNSAGVRIVDRTQTGGYSPPEPGVAQASDGTIVGSLPDDAVVIPGTEVPVNLPGPREPVLDSSGMMSPRWYRFCLELYRRTGGPNDNVNFVPTLRTLAPSVKALSLSGAAPSVEIDHLKEVPVASLAISSEAPTIP